MPGDYRHYAGAVRREYGWLPDGKYRGGRISVLEAFLKRAAIYQTPAFHSRFEQPARAEPRPRAPESLRGLPVLVVDDNAASRASLLRQLEEWGVAANEAPDGPQAIRRLLAAAAEEAGLTLLSLRGVSKETRIPADVEPAEGETLTEAERERLRSLGYTN